MKFPPRRARWSLPAQVIFLTGIVNSSTMAQLDQGYIIRTTPYPVFSNPEAAHYNIKLGKLTARFVASAQIEFNDNINLSEQNPEGDISFGPDFGIGFLWPVTRENVLQLDISAGYRWYLNHPSIQSFNVAPNTRFDYRLFVKDVKINLHDNFFVQVDPTVRPDIGGSASKENVTNFRRIYNTAGLVAEWRPVSKLGLVTGYDYTMDRSMSGAFTSIDRDGHMFSAGAQITLSPRLTLGINGTYEFNHYLEKVQNDGNSYTLGPSLNCELSEFLAFNLAAGYAVSTFESTGTIGDSSGFTGLVAQLGVRHTINSRMTQNLNVRAGPELGFGSNFNDTLSAQYQLNVELSSALTLHSRFVYQHFEASIIGGEKADRYLYYLGTQLQLTRIWRMDVGYAFSVKASDLPGHGYQQNRLTFDLSRQF